jgi:hypothetical protein
VARAATHRRALRLLGEECLGEPVSLIGVYRRRNAPHVRAVVDEALTAGWAVAWWALDEAAGELAEHTVGAGPGEKFPLNAIVEEAELDEGWVVVADDDVAFVRGGVSDFVGLSALAGFALAQPAHTADSTHSYEINLSRALSVARRTTFVEIGPLFTVAPQCRDRIIPFPAERGMGWGLELVWRELLEHGCMLGVVDTVTVRHLTAIGAEYEDERMTEAVMEELGSVGASRWSDLQRTLETWRPWQRRPPWKVRVSG